MTASTFEQDWYLFFPPYSTLYINEAYSEWNIYLYIPVCTYAIKHLHDGVILLPRSESFSFFLSSSILVIPARFKPGVGGTWVFFGWVCATRDSKLAPRS